MGILDRLTRKNRENRDDADAVVFKWGKLVESDKPAESSPSPKPNVVLEPVSQGVEKSPVPEPILPSESPRKATTPSSDDPRVSVKVIPGTVKQVNKKLLDAFTQWLGIEKDRAERTRREYDADVKMFADFLTRFKSGSLKTATVDDVREFVRRLRRKGCGPAGANRRLAALKTFYAWAMREEYVRQNPAASELVDRFKIADRLPVHLTESEHEAFMTALDQINARKRAFISLMNLCGLRISEVCGLQIQNLIRERDKIAAVRVIGKGNKERIAPVHQTLSRYIDEWLCQRNQIKSDYLFPGYKSRHIDRHTGWKWFTEFKAQVVLNPRITPHKLRHTFATRLYRKGTPPFNLQRMLGHADPRTTGIYAHVDYEALQSDIQKLL